MTPKITQELENLRELENFEIDMSGAKTYKIFPCFSRPEVSSEDIQKIVCIREIRVAIDPRINFMECSPPVSGQIIDGDLGVKNCCNDFPADLKPFKFDFLVEFSAMEVSGLFSYSGASRNSQILENSRYSLIFPRADKLKNRKELSNSAVDSS